MTGKVVRQTFIVVATIFLVFSGFMSVSQRTMAATPTCNVQYTVSSQWPGGFTAGVNITNTSTTALSSWTLGFAFPSSTQKVTQGWSAAWTQSGANVTAQSLSYNGTIAPNGSVGIGFNGSYTTSNAVPTVFTLNGATCNQIPPTVAITSPTTGASFTAPANIPITASATDASATISRVEFYSGTSLLGTTTSSPYTFSWNSVAVGTYTLTAKAYGSDGSSATSSPVSVTVAQATTPKIQTSTASLKVNPGGTAQFGVSLSSQPSGTVSVTVAKTGAASVSVSSGATLTFTAANWSTQQNVTVAATTSATTTDTATLTASATGYTSAAVAVSVQSVSTTSSYTQHFLDMYNNIKDPANGYFSSQGIPYHSVETLMVEAPDYGHETTSETFSYWIWLEATYGKETGNWAPFNSAWTTMETYMIPSHADQPTNSFYNPSSPAQYAPESVNISDYPTQLDSTITVGQDPLASELQSTYGTPDIYGMHWLLDTDDWYGYGHCGDGTTKPSFINSYQRGPSESVWKTIVQPSCDTFKFGGPNGFLDLFQKNSGGGAYAQQWKYTDAPDADARTIQAAYWAYTWAAAQGKSSSVSATIAKAAKMGDYLRYSFFDKYFKNPGCVSTSCTAGTGKSSSNYLLSWYYAWGGSLATSGGWAWRIGSSASHQGYQNPLTAWALSTIPALEPLSPTATTDWSTSLTRQMQFYQWLQSSEGAIAGGATNSWNGDYGTPPAGDPTFYGLAYDWEPEYHDPPSNNWFGMQTWSMERVAEYYNQTGNAAAKSILSKWVAWASANTTLNADGTYAIPSTLNWSGQPATWNASSPAVNTGLHVTVVSTTTDVGVTGSFAKVLMYYGSKAGDTASQTLAKALLDRMWTNYRDTIGVAVPETRTDYSQFNDAIYVPSGWTGVNGQGATLNSSTTFISERPKYQLDPAWPKVQAYLNGGAAPTFTYHRFWAQADIAIAYADYDMLYPSS